MRNAKHKTVNEKRKTASFIEFFSPMGQGLVAKHLAPGESSDNPMENDLIWRENWKSTYSVCAKAPKKQKA